MRAKKKKRRPKKRRKKKKGKKKGQRVQLGTVKEEPDAVLMMRNGTNPSDLSMVIHMLVRELPRIQFFKHDKCSSVGCGKKSGRSGKDGRMEGWRGKKGKDGRKEGREEGRKQKQTKAKSKPRSTYMNSGERESTSDGAYVHGEVSPRFSWACIVFRGSRRSGSGRPGALCTKSGSHCDQSCEMPRWL